MLCGGRRHTNIWNSFSRGPISRAPPLGELLPSYSLFPKRGTSQTWAGTSLVPMLRYSTGAGSWSILFIKYHFWLWKRRLYQDCRHGTEGQMCVSGVGTWDGGCVLASERVNMGLSHADCISLNINPESRWHKGRAKWLPREWEPENSSFMPKAQQCEPSAPWPTPNTPSFFFFFLKLLFNL